MICWYCYWGWSKPVVEIYNKAKSELDGDESQLEFGPAHIVWSDENFDISSIDAALKYCEKENDYEIDIIKSSLLELKALPDEIRDPCPNDYDGEHPENYPPINNQEMMKIKNNQIFTNK